VAGPSWWIAWSVLCPLKTPSAAGPEPPSVALGTLAPGITNKSYTRLGWRFFKCKAQLGCKSTDSWCLANAVGVLDKPRGDAWLRCLKYPSFKCPIQLNTSRVVNQPPWPGRRCKHISWPSTTRSRSRSRSRINKRHQHPQSNKSPSLFGLQSRQIGRLLDSSSLSLLALRGPRS
jgi:hypothetical protein